MGVTGQDWYGAWIDEQSARIESELRQHAGRGSGGGLHVYVMPTTGPDGGRLVLASETPHGAHSVVRFPAQGSRVAAVPYSHLRSLLWNACRNVPVLPIPESVA
jgi:hypothetical protein